jgi:hypothetical protein
MVMFSETNSYREENARVCMLVISPNSLLLQSVIFKALTMAKQLEL